MSHSPKKIIIFGGASAIAEATARLFAQDKADITLIDQHQTKLDIVAADLTARGAAQVHTVTADLNQLEHHQDLIQNLLSPKTPDIILFSYGTLGHQKTGEKDFAVANQELTTNFISVASLLTHLTNQLEKSTHPTTIAVITSVAGDRGRASNYIYGTAKGALNTWLAGLRHRLALQQSPIHLLTIKPGFVDTPMTKDFAKGLLWSQPDQVARNIVTAIDKRKNTIYTPWFWRLIMLIIRLLPTPLFHKLKL